MAMQLQLKFDLILTNNEAAELEKHKKNLKTPKKGVIRICKSKKTRQHNGQKKKYRKTNNDLQNIHIKLQIE